MVYLSSSGRVRCYPTSVIWKKDREVSIYIGYFNCDAKLWNVTKVKLTKRNLTKSWLSSLSNLRLHFTFIYFNPDLARGTQNILDYAPLGGKNQCALIYIVERDIMLNKFF